MRSSTLTALAAAALLVTLGLAAVADTGAQVQAAIGPQLLNAERIGVTLLSAPADPGLSRRDRLFLKKVAEDGLCEIRIAQLASTNAVEQPCKDYAQQMITDHTKLNDQVIQLAANKNVTIPTGLDKTHTGEVRRLSKITGIAFDKSFARRAVGDHEAAIVLFRGEIAHGSDPDVVAFAKDTLPILRQHLMMAQSLRDNGMLPANMDMGGSTPH
jgi:putative membrane protein